MKKPSHKSTATQKPIGAYNHSKIEAKWQKQWDKKKFFQAHEPKSGAAPAKKKFYGLIEFPYPSGDGLHVGHIRSNTAMDIIARKRRREGFEVLYPIGWDAFGLPTENYAIKTGIQPAIVTKKNTDIFRRQLKALGFSFDWSREINTTDPAYYRWTQWIFLQFLKKGLAYKKKMTINWCPKDLIGLANEEVVNGCCERCGTPVEKRDKEQWMLTITKYAERLDKDLDSVDFLERIKIQQRNWIGKSEGAEIDFRLGFTNNKTRFVIIHGFEGSAKTNFLPWLKSELEKRGHVVQTPELPNSAHPIETEQIDYVLKNCQFDENTVVIGHSLGAVLASKILMKLNKPISGLVLVAPAIDPTFHAAKMRSYWEGYSWDFDYEAIKKLTGGRIAILSDLQEKTRAVYIRKMLAVKLDAHLIETNAAKVHFCAEKEIEVLKAVTPTVKVFTTRPDTLYGVTYIVLAPEHPWVGPMLEHLENRKEVEEYISKTKKETDVERTDAKKEKTGVQLKGIKAVNPVNNEEIPVWIADYVLADYGTGAVMAVPAHDERDFEFAKKYGLPVKQVVAPYFENTTDLIPKNGKPFVRRSIVHAIIKHPTDKKYLCIKWKTQKWNSFVTGGVENGEDSVSAARREIHEETGYKNLKHIPVPGSAWQVHSYFYAPHKDINRYADAKGVVFELENEEKTDISEEEKSKHDLIWVDADKVRDFLTYENQKIIWDYCANESAYLQNGKLINSSSFDGRDSTSIKKEITDFAGGRWITTFKLRDWVFSRQRYWGEPIPVIHCEKCGIVPVPEKDLPVKLPKVKNYKPTETGESPLAAISKWVNTKCPTCKGKATRETDTMPNWAGSSWYYLRYVDPKNKKAFADRKKLDYWVGDQKQAGGVDWYNGGMEHTTLHLLYSRFWHKFLYDLGLVPTSEPYHKRTSHGLILAAGGEKMSKSKGNVVNPDSIIATVGADSLRLYEMFMGPFDQPIAWNTDNIAGVRRFIERVWRFRDKVQNAKSESQQKIIHKTIKKVTDDIEAMRFNTAISTLMIAMNELEKSESIEQSQYETILQLLAPFAPHVTEELWASLGHTDSIHASPWPVYDSTLATDSEVTIMIQINGKTRASFTTQTDTSKEDIEKLAKENPDAKKWLEGKSISKVIVVPNKLVNIVVA